jgi:hypothetical protein
MRKAFLMLAAGVIAANVGLAADPSVGTPTFIVEPPDPTVATANTGTIPNWTGSFTFNGTTYNYTMVGSNPSGGLPTTITTQVIPLIFQFSDGTILDPTQNSCGDTVPALTRTLNSPIFNATDFAPGGTDVGNTQYVDAFQRANFWSTVSGSNPGYHVLLGTPTVSSPVTITVGSFAGHTAQGPCSASGNTNNGKIGEMRIGSFELQLKRLLRGMPGTTFPIFIFYNTFFTQGGCCILGFHGTVGKAPNQLTYAVAAFSDPGLFNKPIEDIHALSHEIGEWMDDPYTNNNVPGWTGGQVGSCSTLLEVGDPVTGIAFTVNMNGFTYHPEDLVFLPWFEKAGSPTQSVNGWYTFLNSYAAPSPVC